MYRTFRTLFVSLALFIAPAFAIGQSNWYLLQVVHHVDEPGIKHVLARIQAQSPDIKVWFNGTNSNTFGCSSTNAVQWASILTDLRLHGYYVADVTSGNGHFQNAEAVTSISFIRSCYYADHADEIPAGWIAQLNQYEWNALPVAVRNYYQSNNTFEIVEK